VKKLKKKSFFLTFFDIVKIKFEAKIVSKASKKFLKKRNFLQTFFVALFFAPKRAVLSGHIFARAPKSFWSKW